MPLSVDEKEGPFVPKPVPDAAVKASFGPHIDVEVSRCNRGHSLVVLSATLQRVVPLISPVTVHLRVKVSSGQVGGAAVNCPATLPRERLNIVIFIYNYMHTKNVRVRTKSKL